MSFHRQTVLRVATVTDLLSGCGGSSLADCNRSRRPRFLRRQFVCADFVATSRELSWPPLPLPPDGQGRRSVKRSDGARQIEPSNPREVAGSRVIRHSHVSRIGSAGDRPTNAARAVRAIRSSTVLSIVTTRI